MDRAEKMWPTPNRADHLANQSETLEAWEKRAAEKKKEGINLQFALRHAVQKNPTMWPTPSQGMWKQDVNDNGEYAKRVKGKGHQVMLPAAVKLWPTPRASNPGSRPNGKGGKILQEEVLISEGIRKRGQKKEKGGGTLNPTWVEWLMGYKAGYTDLKDWEMLSSRKSRKKSEKQS